MQQIINIGSAPNDGTGDPLRTAFDKSNDNFSELYGKGFTEGVWNYNQVDIDTSTSPVSGRFKTNSADYRTATQIAIHATTIQGINRANTLRTLLVGDIIQCQDSLNGAAWCRYTLQSASVDNGTWFQLNVALEDSGSVASGDNQEILFVFTANSGGGGGGIPDAPSDGLYYARRNTAWADIAINFATTASLASYAPLASPTFTGDPKAPTPATADNDTSIATTAFVKAQGYAPLASPMFTGNPAAPTPTAGDNDTSIATTAFVQTAIAGKADTSALALKADLASPTFTGDPKAPTPATGDNDTSIATTAFVKAQGYATTVQLGSYAPLASPVFTGDPQAPTPPTADNDTSIATTAFVKAQGYAPLASPLFTGDPRAPTPAAGDNDTSIATTAYVQADAGRSRVLLQTINPQGTNIAVVNIPPSGYDWIEIEGFVFRDSGSSFLMAQISTDNGATYHNSVGAYHWAGSYAGSVTTANRSFLGGAQTFLQLSNIGTFNAANPLSLRMLMHRPAFAGSGCYRGIEWCCGLWDNVSDWYTLHAMGALIASGLPLTNMAIVFNDGGNFSASIPSLIKVWGHK